jgi:hypothetical protein
VSTSGTFSFQSPQNEQIITDAYERISITADKLTQEKINSAQRSLNFILTSWINRGLLLWSVKFGMLALYNNQSTYSLPIATSDVLEATIRTSVRNLGGAAFSSSGVAQNAFDNNPQTACTQNAINGTIGYSWNNSQYPIAMVGVQSNVTRTYALVFEFSNDNVAWTQAGAPVSQSYQQGIIAWFVISVPTLGSYFRIRETGGAILDIQELYFNTCLNDTLITRISRSEYLSYPNKNQTGRPTSFFVNRQAEPVITLWPTPNNQYNNLFYTRIEMPQDIGVMTNSPPISARFLEPLTACLSYKLSIKEGVVDRMAMLKQDSTEEYNFASEEDRERVPLRIYGDFMQGWASS